jgi:transcription initiation factor IIE alpha subunit
MSSRVGVRALETAVLELFDSRAESRVYLFLLRHDGVLSEEVIRGTRLHPSTVRELLSSMYEARVVSRRKLRTESIGKNPYLYYAVSPLVLLRRRVKTLERRLNLVAAVASPQDAGEPVVRISIREDAA